MVLINRSEGNLNASTYQKQRMSSAVPSTTIYWMRDMNYQKIYDDLVEKRKHSLFEGYSENHHIVPKCIGGDDSASNLVALSAREHFVAHLLLVQIHMGNRKLFHAV